jgi:hypothetical protein
MVHYTDSQSQSLLILFRHTQYSYTSKVTSYGLFTGRYQA